MFNSPQRSSSGSINTSIAQKSLIGTSKTMDKKPAPSPPPRDSSTIKPSGGPSMSDRERRNRVAFEILSTEEAYVDSLHLLFKFYIKPLQQNELIGAQKLATIVGNLDQILIINQELLEALKTKMESWETHDYLGDAMKKLLPFLRLYSQYYSGYHDANALLAKLMERSSVADFLNKTRDDNQILDMPALLIMPVQRVPRYKLLLEQLLKYTPESHGDYKDLQICLKDVQEVADILNKGIAQKERLDSLLRLEKRLSGNVPKNLAQSHRVLIHEGELTKLCRKVPKRRYFFLFNDLLLYGEPTLLTNISTSSSGEDEKEKEKEIKISLSVNLLTGHGKIIPIQDSSKAKNAFQILSTEKSFIAWAASPEEKELWVTKILEADKSREEIVHVGDKHDAETFAPTWQNDEDSDICPACFVKFTAFRRKHHCRKCGSLVCGKCSDYRLELSGISGGKQRVCEGCWKSEGGAEKKSSKDQEKKTSKGKREKENGSDRKEKK